MKKLSNILMKRVPSIQRELVKVEECRNCGKELNTFKTRLIGGPKKGQLAVITEECDCYLSQQVLNAVNRTKLRFFREHSTINDSLKQATLYNYSPNNDSQVYAVKKAIDFIEKQSGNVVARTIFYGDPGLGKSHLAVGIAKILEEKYHKTCLFLEVPILKQLVKSSWSNGSARSELEIMRAIAEADLLILDDVGAEGITPWTKELMFTILNSRLSKSLLVTTNLSLSDIYTNYGSKITDRFLENMSKDDIVKIEGEHSYRLKPFLEEKGSFSGQ